MHAYLFAHLLPKVEGAEPRDAAEAAAALLYFDSVQIATLLPVNEAAARIRAAVDALDNPTADVRGISVQDPAYWWRRAAVGVEAWKAVGAEYWTLILGGTVRLDPMFSDWALSQNELVRMIEVVLPDVLRWSNESKLPGPELALSADALLATPWIAEGIADRLTRDNMELGPVELASVVAATAYLVAGVEQTTKSIGGRSHDTATLFAHPHHQRLYEYIVAPELVPSIPDTHTQAPHAYALLAEILRDIPSIVPRSAEGILEIKHGLRDELGEFAQVLQETIADLQY